MREDHWLDKRERHFQVGETACAKAQGKKEKRMAGPLVSLELSMYEEVGSRRRC